MSLSCPPELAGMAGGAVFKLGSFGNFAFAIYDLRIAIYE
jgi:hypothetical protein